MPQFRTQHFGLVEYEEESALLFPDGLLAFEQCTQFVIIEQSQSAPLIFLQSLDDAALCFVTMPAACVEATFRVQLEEEDARKLGLDSAPADSDLLCLTIITLSEKAPPTANLLAPVVIHRISRRAVQVVQSDSPFSCRHVLGNEKEPAC